MRKPRSSLGGIAIGAAVAAAVLAAYLLASRISPSLVGSVSLAGRQGTAEDRSPTGRQPAAQAKPDPTRPADVGNQAAEDFWRKLDAKPAVPARGRILVSDEGFASVYDELYDRRSEFYGREIELSGFAMGQPGLAAGSFLLGRELVWCCEDDKYFIGFLVLADGATPADGTGFRVTGTITPSEYRDPETGRGFTVPAIRASRVDPEPGVAKRVFRAP